MTLRNNGRTVAFVDATALTNVLELSDRVRTAVTAPRSSFAMGAEAVKDVFVAQSADRAHLAAASRTLSSNLRALADEERAVVLVDAAGSPEAVFELFGRMRDALWQLPHSWVVAIDDTDRATVLKPPADAFFDAIVTLHPWSTNQVAGLLARRLDDQADRTAVTQAAASAEGIPRDALRALNDAIVHGRNPADVLAERARLLDRASALGRSYGMLMAELLDRGQASPSDDELQATLGLTRARLTHLLRDLQGHGLVKGHSERSAGPGRPKTLYRPALST